MMCATPDIPAAPAPPPSTIPSAEFERLLRDFPGSRVTLAARTHLSDEVVRQVRERVCNAAGREIILEVRVSPTMEAGAVLLVGDSGRVVLDPRVMWLSQAEQQIREQLDSGALTTLEDTNAHLLTLLEHSTLAPSIESLLSSGTVMRVGDGVASVSGLRDVGSQEVVEFEDGTLGLAFSLAEQFAGCVLLGPDDNIREGGGVRRTGRQLSVPVGQAVLGRVLDALCRPLDGGDPIVPSAWSPAEQLAPGVVERQPVDQPLLTGMKIVDALVPIGRGQRELIIGDRKLGKTTIAVDTILAQKGQGVSCIYCAIGQKASSVRQVISTLEALGAMEYTAVVVSLPSDMPALRYVAPYTACAIGEYFRDHGQDALVVYDDLSKHAVTYREMSALLDRPVGREAYPGDIFYVHSRLLERAARLSQERGGGSLSALPIVETLSGDISAFIPTNVISICDGQIVLDSVAFNEGRRPSMDPGLSVSRVGGTAQSRIMKQVAGRLRIDLAQYGEMARFVKFGAEVDEATQHQLARGERARELLKQDQHSPMPVEDEALILFGAVNGFFDGVDVDEAGEAQDRLIDWMHSRHAGVMRGLSEGEGLTPELEASLGETVQAFFADYAAKAASAQPEA
jgi:F-type H+-transporting ATPase subunit alpha